MTTTAWLMTTEVDSQYQRLESESVGRAGPSGGSEGGSAPCPSPRSWWPPALPGCITSVCLSSHGRLPFVSLYLVSPLFIRTPVTGFRPYPPSRRPRGPSLLCLQRFLFQIRLTLRFWVDTSFRGHHLTPFSRRHSSARYSRDRTARV